MSSITTILNKPEYAWIATTPPQEVLYLLSTENRYLADLQSMNLPLNIKSQKLYADSIQEGTAASEVLQYVRSCVPSSITVKPAQNNFEFIPLRNLLTYVLRKQGHGVTSAQQRSFSSACSSQASLSSIPCSTIKAMSAGMRTWLEQLTSDNQCAVANALLLHTASPMVPIAAVAKPDPPASKPGSSARFKLPTYATAPKLAYAKQVESDPGFLHKYGLYIIGIIVLAFLILMSIAMSRVPKEDGTHIVGSCLRQEEFVRQRKALELKLKSESATGTQMTTV